MAKHQSLVHEGEVAVENRDLQRREHCGAARLAFGTGAAAQGLLDALSAGSAEAGRREGRLGTWRSGATGPPRVDASGRSLAALDVAPRVSNSQVVVERALLARQRTVLTIQRPGLHAGQQG